ncbi:MAG: alginate lyase family protein [Candidatus Latescibacteria bacterium]|nr:alginate lyase family protein [Candidatus Latescibacterota bacterium]
MQAEEIVPRVRIEDDAEFFSLWNLDLPELADVKAAADTDGMAAAKVALKAYFLQRREPRWKINHWEMPPEPQGKPEEHPAFETGEDVLAHRFSSHGFTVEHGEKIDWNYFPLRKPDGKIDFEYGLTHNISRFYHFSDVLGPLYWFTHDERYAREFVYEVTDFVLSHPAPEKFWPEAPGPWRRLTSASPLCGQWLNGYNYFLSSEHFTPKAHAVMLKGFIEKARFAARNPDAVNRYMVQLAGIYIVGAYFPELIEAEGLRDFSEQAMEAAIEDEFYPDFISKELCPGYQGTSRYAVRSMVDAARLMGYTPSRILVDGLESAYDFYPLVATPVRSIPQFGDTRAAPDMLGKTFGEVIDLFDKPVYRWFISDGQEGEPPEFVSVHMPWAGFYMMRSGWDREARYLCLDAGPLGKGHWHEDYLNFECYGYGEILIAEVGVYSYVTDKWRAYFRSSLAHNVVVVDGLGQNRSCNAPRVIDSPREKDWHCDNVFDLAWGFYDGLWSHYLDSDGKDAVDLATHRRDVCFVKDEYWIVSDRLCAPGEHHYSQLFHFEPDRDVQVLDEQRAGTVDLNRPNVVLIQADPVKAKVIVGQEHPLQGWFSGGQREKEPAPVLSFDQTDSDGAVYDTVIFPLNVGQVDGLSVERFFVIDGDGELVTTWEICALCVSSGFGTDYYINDLRQEEIGPLNGRIKRAGHLETDARAAVVRLDSDGCVIAASAVGATFLGFNDRDLLD